MTDGTASAAATASFTAAPPEATKSARYSRRISSTHSSRASAIPRLLPISRRREPDRGILLLEAVAGDEAQNAGVSLPADGAGGQAHPISTPRLGELARVQEVEVPGEVEQRVVRAGEDRQHLVKANEGLIDVGVDSPPRPDQLVGFQQRLDELLWPRLWVAPLGLLQERGERLGAKRGHQFLVHAHRGAAGLRA